MIVTYVRRARSYLTLASYTTKNTQIILFLKQRLLKRVIKKIAVVKTCKIYRGRVNPSSIDELIRGMSTRMRPASKKKTIDCTHVMAMCELVRPKGIMKNYDSWELRICSERLRTTQLVNTLLDNRSHHALKDGLERYLHKFTRH